MQQIKEKLSEDNYVFLEGIGGIGKTELAKSFACENKYDIVQFVNFGRNLRETIAYDLAFFNFDITKYDSAFGKDALKHIFQDKVNRLKQNAETGQKILIIIDNYSHTSLQDFKMFTSGQYHVIFTTREKLGGIEVSPMNDDSLFAVFCKYYAPMLPSANDVPIIHKIIKTAAGHTMSVMLIAAAMKNDQIEAGEMLKRLKDGTAADTQINLDKEWIDESQQTMRKHIFTLFNMTVIKSSKEFSNVMVNMSIVPETGLEKNEFYQMALHKQYYDTYCFDLDWLIKRRWVQEHYNDGDSYVSLHAVIADVVSRELLPNSVNCGDLINGLLSFANESTYMEAANAANKLKTACRRINDATPLTEELYFKFARLCSFLADYDSSLEYYKKTVLIRVTASNYNNIAKIYADKGDYTEALEWYGKTIDTLAETYDDELAATVFGNLGGIHIHNKDFDLAIECYQRALSSYVSMHGYEHPDSARLINNIACAYLHKKDYGCAKSWFEKALALRKKILGEYHPDTAATYGNIALGCCELGQYDKALKLEEKALTIREKTFGKENPKTAASYNAIGLIYHCKKDFDKALEFYKKALAINEKMLGSEHPNTIKTQRNIHELTLQTQAT
jgi:tetratricopeptide (TPR) repeat protein